MLPPIFRRTIVEVVKVKVKVFLEQTTKWKGYVFKHNSVNSRTLSSVKDNLKMASRGRNM